MNGSAGGYRVRVTLAAAALVLGAGGAGAGLVDWGAGLLKNWPGGAAQSDLADAENEAA